MIFAEVIVDISVRSLDRPFQYLVPEELSAEAVIGAQVTIPFGQGNRVLTGYIIGLSSTPQYDISRTKSILNVKKQSIAAESHLLSLAWWMKEKEHETSYRSENPPKYHAREVAVQRAKMLGASVVLGSATPSLEAYYRCSTKEYTLFTLKQRAGGASLPRVWTVDLRQELARKNYSIFSRLLQENIY